MGTPHLRPDCPEPSNPKGGPELQKPASSERRNAARLLQTIAGWVGATTAFLALILCFGVLILLHNPGFHRYLRTTVERRVSESLGVAVQIQEFTLHLSTLSLDLYGVTIHGAKPYPDPPLLQVQHIDAGVRIVSVFQRKWYFSKIEIDRPVVQIFVDTGGNSNLPKLTSNSSSNSNTSVFDLGIRHAILEQGEVFYNNRPEILSADLHDFDYRGSFNDLLQDVHRKPFLHQWQRRVWNISPVCSQFRSPIQCHAEQISAEPRNSRQWRFEPFGFCKSEQL